MHAKNLFLKDLAKGVFYPDYLIFWHGGCHKHINTFIEHSLKLIIKCNFLSLLCSVSSSAKPQDQKGASFYYEDT